MQLDNRADFSLDSLRKYSAGFRNIPQLSQLKTVAQFAGCGPGQQILNFAYSKQLINKWYSKERLQRLTLAIRNRDNFYKAFVQ